MGARTGANSPALADLVRHYKELGADVMLTCTTVNGVLGSCDDYCRMAKAAGVDKVCFRELNKCDAGAYGRLGSTYSVWREKNIVTLGCLSAVMQDSAEFEFKSQTVRPYLYHEYWEHKPTGVEVCLRQVDESELASWEDAEGTETVVYPDGNVSCGWNHAKGDAQ
jgi:hypothetical protein